MLKSTALFGALAFALVACGSPSATDSNTAEPTPAVTTDVAADAVSTGTFTGASDHVTTGGVRLIGTTGSYQLVFANDFSLDGAPDPVVGFGQNGKYNPDTSLGALQNKTGAQTYTLPADFDPATNTEVYVWCDQFSVPLGIATLTN